MSIIKTYEELRSHRIQARISESSENGTQRYLIRIGLSKILVDLIDNDIKYVMDLC